METTHDIEVLVKMSLEILQQEIVIFSAENYTNIIKMPVVITWSRDDLSFENKIKADLHMIDWKTSQRILNSQLGVHYRAQHEYKQTIQRILNFIFLRL